MVSFFYEGHNKNHLIGIKENQTSYPLFVSQIRNSEVKQNFGVIKYSQMLWISQNYSILYYALVLHVALWRCLLLVIYKLGLLSKHYTQSVGCDKKLSAVGFLWPSTKLLFEQLTSLNRCKQWQCLSTDSMRFGDGFTEILLFLKWNNFPAKAFRCYLVNVLVRQFCSVK